MVVASPKGDAEQQIRILFGHDTNEGNDQSLSAHKDDPAVELGSQHSQLQIENSRLSDRLRELKDELEALREENNSLTNQLTEAKELLAKRTRAQQLLKLENRSLSQELERFESEQQAALVQSLRLEPHMITPIDEGATEITLKLTEDDLSVFEFLSGKLRAIRELERQEEEAVARKRTEFQEQMSPLTTAKEELQHRLERLNEQQQQLKKTESALARKIQHLQAIIRSKEEMLDQLQEKMASANGWMIQFYQKENIRLAEEIQSATSTLDKTQQLLASTNEEIAATESQMVPLRRDLKDIELTLRKLEVEWLRFEESAFARLCELGSGVGLYLLMHLQTTPSFPELAQNLEDR